MSDLSKIKIGETIRDSVHNLVIQESNEIENETYFERFKHFIIVLEGIRYDAYLDGIPDPKNPARFISATDFYSLDQSAQDVLRADCWSRSKKKPITTVGIGANIEQEKVRRQYDKLLGTAGLMQRVYEGQKKLTDEHVGQIFKESIRVRLIALRDIYGSDWDKLRANERMAILSLYFNFPGLVNRGANFRKQIGKYVETSDVRYLLEAIKEILERSNPDNHEGIQSRREAEAELLSSHKCPAYTKPHESPDAVKIREAHLNDTIMAINCDPSCSEQEVNADYFVWRTQMDHKVRENHLKNEGKIFRHDNPPGFLPGETHNCRCQAENVPDDVFVHDDIADQKAFILYLKKGITPRYAHRDNVPKQGESHTPV